MIHGSFNLSQTLSLPTNDLAYIFSFNYLERRCVESTSSLVLSIKVTAALNNHQSRKGSLWLIQAFGAGRNQLKTINKWVKRYIPAGRRASCRSLEVSQTNTRDHKRYLASQNVFAAIQIFLAGERQRSSGGESIHFAGSKHPRELRSNLRCRFILRAVAYSKNLEDLSGTHERLHAVGDHRINCKISLQYAHTVMSLYALVDE
jgi:hypothetical protein